MHFRVRGNNVQVVKTVVDKKTLKSKSVPVGSANIRKGILSDELTAQLLPEEIKQVRDWIQNRQRIHMLRLEVEAYTLSDRIYQAAEWLKLAKPAESADVASEILRAVNSFRRNAITLGIVKKGAR